MDVATEIRRDIDTFVLTEMVGDLGICCDNADYHWCPKGEAEWVARVFCPKCIRSAAKLFCTGCKDFLMHTEDALECASCDEVIVPARRGIATIDPINKRGA